MNEDKEQVCAAKSCPHLLARLTRRTRQGQSPPPVTPAIPAPGVSHSAGAGSGLGPAILPEEQARVAPFTIPESRLEMGDEDSPDQTIWWCDRTIKLNWFN